MKINSLKEEHDLSKHFYHHDILMAYLMQGSNRLPMQ